MPYTPDAMMGGIALKAAGLIAVTTAHTEVHVGHGPFCVRAALTACEIASNDEFYKVTVEANTLAAPTTWTEIGVLGVFGATEVMASSGDTAATAAVKAGFVNPYDDKVRLKTWVSGTIATGINFAADLFPIENLTY